jgi:hypothetical protein
MSSNRRTENSAEHLEVSALLPWYVNETLEDPDRQRVAAHVGICILCREDLAAQRHIHAAIAAQPALDYVPVASLKRLQARLDAAQSGSAATPVPPQEPAGYRARPWRGWIAASIAAMAVAVALLAADRWVQVEARRSQADYRTVTSSAPRPQGEVIRAVFSPNITLVELQALLDEAQLSIVSGPTEAGVYSLASNSTLSVRASLALLRRHSTVRFAEGTLPEPASGNSR